MKTRLISLGPRWTSFVAANQNTISKCSRSPIFHLLVVVAGFLIIFSRRPDAILNAQFWAEDGQRWYADAYQFGIRCLLIPDELGGYFHSVSRLSALTALIFPFSMAPLVMNLFAIAIQILPASIFLSSRFSNIALWKRLVAAFVYFALPNTYEVNANTTTIQWHLGLLACMVLLAPSARNWKWQVFDGVVLVLISLDSPVGVVLLPVAAVVWWMRRSRGSAISLAMLFSRRSDSRTHSAVFSCPSGGGKRREPASLNQNFGRSNFSFVIAGEYDVAPHDMETLP